MVTRNEFHYGVAVGINFYPGWSANLSGPVGDARAFAKWLRDPAQGGLPRANVTSVVTKPPRASDWRKAEPRKDAINDAVNDACNAFLERLKNAAEEDRDAMRSKSRLYLFVAGHGTMPRGSEGGLLDARSQPERPFCLDLGLYLKWFKENSIFAEVCIFADCCRTFENTTEGFGPDFLPATEPPEPVRVLLAYATNPGHLSFEDHRGSASKTRGHFTYALLQGLYGSAADSVTGLVTGDRLINYTRDVVAKSTEHKPAFEQQYVPDPQLVGTIVFGPRREPSSLPEGGGAPPGRALRRARIRFASQPHGRVELVAPGGVTDIWDPRDGEWVKWLYDGVWYIQHAGSAMDTSGFLNDGVFVVSGGDIDVTL